MIDHDILVVGFSCLKMDVLNKSNSKYIHTGSLNFSPQKQ